jgi:uncharacterized protein
VRFWDSSAVVPLLVREANSERVAALLGEDPDMIVSWSTPLECASALSRTRRAGHIDVATESALLDVLRELSGEWSEVQPTEHVRLTAMRLLRTHPLRAADALQLAAALAWEARPAGDVFITFDDRLATAAALEGFAVNPITHQRVGQKQIVERV